MTQDTEEEVGKLFVGGLSWETTKEKLNDYFNRFGEIADCVVMKNPETGRSRGFGFVTFKDPNCVQSVLNSGPHHLDDRTIDPKSCNPKSAQKGKRDAKMANYPKIFLGGLPSDVNETVLRQFFSEYGKVVEVVIMYDQEKKKTRGNGFRGFGFLSFESEEAVNKVVGEHFVVISGKKVEVKRAEPREKSTNGIKSTLGSGNSPGSANDSQNGLSLLPSWWPQAGLPGSLSAAAAAAAAATANSIITSSPQLASTPLPVALPATGMMQPPPATPYPMWTHLPGWVPASSTTRMNGQTIPGQPSSGPGSGTQNFGPPTTVTVTTATAQPPTAPGGWSAPPMPAIYPPYPPWPPSGYPYPGLPPPPHHIWPNQSYLYGSTYPVGYPGYIPGGPISPGLSPSLLPGTVTLPQSSSTANLIVAANQQQPGPINQNSSGGSSQVPTSNNLTITTTSGNFSGSCSVSSASGAGTGQTNGLDPRSNQSTQSGDYAHEVSNYGPTRIYGLHSTESGNNAGNLGGHHNSTNQSLGTSYLRNSSIQAYHPYRRI